MREGKDDGIAYEDRLTLNQPPDQTKPTILHQAVIRPTTKPSTQRVTSQIDDHQGTYTPGGPGKLSERPCNYSKPYTPSRGHNSEPPCT